VLATSRTETSEDWNVESLTAHLAQGPVVFFQDTTRKRLFRDIGLCLTCLVSGTLPLQCPTAVICSICNSTAIHDTECRNLRQKNQRGVVWKHWSEKQVALKEAHVMTLLCSLYAVDRRRAESLAIQDIARAWTRNDPTVSPFLNDGFHETGEEAVEIEIPNFDHLKFSSITATPLSRVAAKYHSISPNHNPGLMLLDSVEQDLESDDECLQDILDTGFEGQEARLDEFDIADDPGLDVPTFVGSNCSNVSPPASVSCLNTYVA
jgi:hypothetical protein